MKTMNKVPSTKEGFSSLKKGERIWGKDPVTNRKCSYRVFGITSETASDVLKFLLTPLDGEGNRAGEHFSARYSEGNLIKVDESRLFEPKFHPDVVVERETSEDSLATPKKDPKAEHQDLVDDLRIRGDSSDFS
jgi:hypothetical protein